ncbi:hypothetical protein Q6U52_000862 [Vibrio alginolyticus]|nr:hypothetical protein [Vibrio alginolyticus]
MERKNKHSIKDCSKSRAMTDTIKNLFKECDYKIVVTQKDLSNDKK